jgi:hypothetical protein
MAAGLFLGSALMFVVDLFAQTTIWSVISGVSLGSGAQQAQEALIVPLGRMIGQIVKGIGISCFWSISTVIYLLLRLEVDRVPLERLAADDVVKPVREPFPVVGIPATDAKFDSSDMGE